MDKQREIISRDEIPEVDIKKQKNRYRKLGSIYDDLTELRFEDEPIELPNVRDEVSINQIEYSIHDAIHYAKLLYIRAVFFDAVTELENWYDLYGGYIFEWTTFYSENPDELIEELEDTGFRDPEIDETEEGEKVVMVDYNPTRFDAYED